MHRLIFLPAIALAFSSIGSAAAREAPDLIFDRRAETLTWLERGKSWRAVSGGHGLGELPAGDYSMVVFALSPYVTGYDPAYTDETGRGFFLPIEPRFSTKRSGLGLHPDGGARGTEGCIGLAAGESASFYREMRRVRRRFLFLRVR